MLLGFGKDRLGIVHSILNHQIYLHVQRSCHFSFIYLTNSCHCFQGISHKFKHIQFGKIFYLQSCTIISGFHIPKNLKLSSIYQRNFQSPLQEKAYLLVINKIKTLIIYFVLTELCSFPLLFPLLMTASVSVITDDYPYCAHF